MSGLLSSQVVVLNSTSSQIGKLEVRCYGKDKTARCVEGNVTALEPNKFLRFTVFDARDEKKHLTEEDGITFKLTEQNDKTILQISQGDYSIMAEGEKYQRITAETWDRVLPKIKMLAEK